MKENLRKSKADHLLEGLTYKEINKFNKFIINRLDGSGERIYKYWEFRLSQKKLAGSFTLSNERGNFSRKIISDFVKILEKFYALKGFDKDSLSEKGYLIRELRDRHLYKLFNSLLDDTKQFHKTVVRKGYMNYLNLLRLNLEEYFLFNSRNEDLKLFETSINMSAISEIIYIQSKLFENINKKLYGFECNINKHDYIDRQPYRFEHTHNKDELSSIDGILEFVKRNSDIFKLEHQGVYMLYLIYEMIENFDDDSKSLEALNYIKKNYNYITVNFLQLCYEAIIRFYVFKINSGNSQSLNDLYVILKAIEKKELFVKIQHIQPLNFLAAIRVSLAFEDINFANRFLTKYSNKMNSEYRKQVCIICQAMIEFYKGHYSTAKKLLINDKTKNVSLYIYSKITLLKALYELNDIRLMIPLIDTIKHYLNRHILTKGPYKDSIFVFLNYLISLTTAKRKNGRGAERLMSKLNDDTLCFQKKWIVMKAEELQMLSLS